MNIDLASTFKQGIPFKNGDMLPWNETLKNVAKIQDPTVRKWSRHISIPKRDKNETKLLPHYEICWKEVEILGLASVDWVQTDIIKSVIPEDEPFAVVRLGFENESSLLEELESAFGKPKTGDSYTRERFGDVLNGRFFDWNISEQIKVRYIAGNELRMGIYNEVNFYPLDDR